MKKIIALIMALVMVLGFTACGTGVDEATVTTAPQASQNPMSETTEPESGKTDVSNATIICNYQPGVYAAGSPTFGYFEDFEKSLEEAFEGRLDLVTLPQDSMGDAELIEQCMMGTCDMINIGDMSFDIISGKIGWAFLPMMYSDYDDVDARYLDGWVSEGITDALAEMGLVRVGYTEAGFRQVCNNKQPIEQMSDFDGIKLRVAQLSYLVDFYSGCGALPVAMANGEVPSAIEQGTIDGQDNYFTAFYNLGTLDMTRYITMLDYLYCANSICLSQSFWDSLTPEDQELFYSTAQEVSKRQLKNFRDFEQDIIDEYVGNGTIEVVYPDDEFKAELKKVAMKVWETEAEKYAPEIMERVFEEFGI